MLHFGFKHKDGRLCPLSGSGRVLLSVLYCFSYTNWREIWVPSRTAMSNGTNICHVLILSTGRNLCAREWSVWIFKKHIHRDSYPSTQTCIYFSLTGGKVKKKLGIITMQRDEDDNDPACASESFLLLWDCSPGTSFTEAAGKNMCCRKNSFGSHQKIQSAYTAWLLCQLQLHHLFK